MALFSRRNRRTFIARALDYFVKIKKNRVVVVCKRQSGFNGNIRLVGEELQRNGYEVGVYWECDESTIQKILDSNSEFKKIKFFNKYELKALFFLLSARIVLLSHSIRDGYISRRKKDRIIINLWHGVPIKGIELAMANLTPKRERLIRQNAKLYDHMISSSRIDRLAMSACFGINPKNVWVTGLPRYDFITRSIDCFAEDIQNQKNKIRKIKNGRRLVLYAPTFREKSESPFRQIGHENLKKISRNLASKNSVLGVRCHRYDTLQLFTDEIIMVGGDDFPETNIVLSETDVLVTDFSSIWIDYLILGRPIIGFAPDYNDYIENERGSLYDFMDIFPGEFFSDLDMLNESILASLDYFDETRLSKSKELFLKVRASKTTDLVVEKIRKNYSYE